MPPDATGTHSVLASSSLPSVAVLSTMTAASLLSGAATVMCPLVVSAGRVNKTLHENSMFNDVHEE